MQQFDLLSTGNPESIQLEDAELLYWPQFCLDDSILAQLKDSIAWQKETIRIAGVERLVPRLTAWYGETGVTYRYSGVDHKASPWTPELLKIKQRLQDKTGESINSALCNLYRNGQDSVAWHSDDEPELGPEPIIASVSFGATRSFHLKHKYKANLRHKIALTSGSLLIMKGKTQSHWQHQVPKEPQVSEPRINITFRTIIG